MNQEVKMKYCATCGKAIDDNADVCLGCGCSTRNFNSSNRQTIFCTNCGKEISANAVVCLNCGCSVSSAPLIQNKVASNELVNKLSKRLKINAVIWFCVAALQIIAGLTYNWILLIPGVLNILSACLDLKHSNDFFSYRNGIIKEYEPLVGPIITAVYNLIIGGVVGVAGSVYYFVAIRQFVLDNRQAFEALESESQPAFDKNNL